MNSLASAEKFPRTSTPLPNSFVPTEPVNGMNNSYISCMENLKEHPQRFVLHGAKNGFLPGILCGMLFMEARDVPCGTTKQRNCKVLRKTSGVVQKPKSIPECYKVRSSRRIHGCVYGFHDCNCGLA